MAKILLVEDDSAISMGIEFALKKEGYCVEVVNTVESAKARLTTVDYGLILLDVMLADGNGYDLCKHIRESSDVPLIFLTACDEEVNVVLGLDIGGDDYITKPFRVNELMSRMKAVIRRKGGLVHTSCISSGAVKFYPLETKVRVRGEEINLTHAEYKLLSILLQNPLQTMTRELLIEKLWDVEGEFVDGNTLSVYIRRLREKLEPNPSEPEYIVTVRGIGYKWNRKHEV